MPRIWKMRLVDTVGPNEMDFPSSHKILEQKEIAEVKSPKPLSNFKKKKKLVFKTESYRAAQADLPSTPFLSYLTFRSAEVAGPMTTLA